MKINFKDKNTIILLVTLAVVTVVAIGVGIYYFITSTSSGIKVEDFVGKPVQDVMSWVDANKLTEEQVEYVYQFDETIVKDQVLSQSMQQDETLEKDGKITFTVSQGPDTDLVIAFPDFTNMTKEEILAFFEQNKFSDVSYEYTTDKKIEKDHFIKINIEGTEARRSDLIVVTFSVGETNVGIDITMPDFKDSTRANIKAWADTNNITVTFKVESSETIEEGKIISQSVGAGETIQTGSKVTIVLSGGKGVVLTNLKGKTKEEVETWAKENSATVSFISYYADSTEEGKVISTTPSSGTIATGTTIKVYLSLGSVKAIDFTDKKEADVKAWIETINKSIYDKNNYIKYTITTDNSSTKAAGTIIKTNPAKDGLIKLAGSITVTVAGTKTVTVESKSNITVDELKTYVVGLGMTLGSKTSEVYSDSIASGKIVRNDSGSKTVGTAINYTTSLGAYTPSGSSFDSKTSTDITNILSAAKSKEAGNWVLATTEAYSSTVAKGYSYGCSVNQSGKKVSCTISKGAGVTVKNYVNSTKPCSADSCSADNLTIKQVYQTDYNSAVAKDTVIGQSISSGTIVDSGTTITLTLSRGPAPTPTPTTQINIGEIGNLDFYEASGDYEKAKANIVNALTGLGFTNIRVVKLTGATDNPNGYVGLIKGITPNSGTIPANTEIVVEIYGS